ncbi:hypothetical protein EV426DRAFT_601644 [Tirmania nivea]|nr:hypothetical protein EV426DRAFT_601644 [Tirmania nivea]
MHGYTIHTIHIIHLLSAVFLFFWRGYPDWMRGLSLRFTCVGDTFLLFFDILFS